MLDFYAGHWQAGQRQGQGLCKFADGTKFLGEWEEDCWLQSVAEPSLSRVCGKGLTRCVAGCPTMFFIQAGAACLPKDIL